jgi:cytochrome P450
MTKWSQERNGFFIGKMLLYRTLGVHDPDIIKEVMPTILVKSDSYDIVKPLIGMGLLTSNGDLWKKQRRLIEPAFHTDNLKSTANVTRVIQLY